MRYRKRILCVCAQGINRSRYLAGYLNKKGYETRFGGIEKRVLFFKPSIPIKQDDVDWAEVIVIVNKNLVSLFKRKFEYDKKRIIGLNVTDSRKELPKKYEYLKNASYDEFAKKYRNPELRKQISKCLPL